MGPAFDYKSVLQQMIQHNASDLHLKVGRPPTLRVDGHMQTLDLPALKQEDLRSLAEQIMAPKNIKEFSENKESDFALAVPGVGRFRVNAYQQRGTIAYALRTVPFQAKTVSELNLPEAVERISLLPRGLILVTGITGSGKSTALASMLHYINQNRHANIITIEDPIEFLHRDIKSSINQREVGTDTTSFGHALRRVLRQDPDIILVGELRDLGIAAGQDVGEVAPAAGEHAGDLGPQAHLRPDHPGVTRHALAVTRRLLVARVDRGRERLDQREPESLLRVHELRVLDGNGC